MSKKCLMTNLMFKPSCFDIIFFPAFKVWRDISKKLRSYENFIKMEWRKDERCTQFYKKDQNYKKMYFRSTSKPYLNDILHRVCIILLTTEIIFLWILAQ
jgi:hypothetical protein